ncbi:VOC family protein [Mycolicibacterium sp. 018/SC-01/001]|uniref:VOC family protein n=1 Tax=Mycolicibacterium sp. 018/SC-01/001 TaxID=2592069 RepID=UPI0011810622|nr:VOC family protein [Mycolicibacterium sp. 018/SC-01/001]TRW81486.1 VOC family protein [Mycolicibacterium sp. 018/SC-01/001]
MPPLTVLELYVSDLERSRRFYTCLGLTFTREQYGDRPVHYATLVDGDIILRLLPAGEGPPTRTRLGFALTSPGAVAETVGATRYSVKDRRGMLLTALDPDGNVVELTSLTDFERDFGRSASPDA